MTERTPLNDPEFLRFYESRYWSSASLATTRRIFDWQRHPNVRLYGLHDPARQVGAAPDHYATTMTALADGLAVVRVGHRETWKFAESAVPNVPRLRSAARRAARDLLHDPVFLLQDTTNPLATVANTTMAYVLDNREWVERSLANDPTGGALVFALLGTVMSTVKNAIRGRRASDGARVNLMRPDDAIPSQAHNGEVCEESGLVSYGLAPWEVREPDQGPGKNHEKVSAGVLRNHDRPTLIVYDSDKGEEGPTGPTDGDVMPPPASSSGEHATTGAGEREGTPPARGAPVHDDPHERMTDVVERLGGAVLQTAPNGFTYVRCPVSHGKRWSTAGVSPDGFVYTCNVCGSFDVAGLVAHVRGGTREEARAWVRSLGWELHEPGGSPVRHGDGGRDSDYQVNPSTPGQRDMFNIRRDTA